MVSNGGYGVVLLIRGHLGYLEIMVFFLVMTR